MLILSRGYYNNIYNRINIIPTTERGINLFQVEDLSFLAKRNNKAFSEKTRKEFQDTISPDETITFYSLFDSTCQPDRLFILREKDGGSLSMSLINFLRGILNLFKVRPTTKIFFFSRSQSHLGCKSYSVLIKFIT